MDEFSQYVGCVTAPAVGKTLELAEVFVFASEFNQLVGGITVPIVGETAQLQTWSCREY